VDHTKSDSKAPSSMSHPKLPDSTPRGLGALAAAVVVLEYVVYFRQRDHFFQADTIYWLDMRMKSWAAFWSNWITLDPSGWYRPLAGRMIPTIFFPVFGLNPAPYRLVLLCFFVAVTLAFVVLAKSLTGSRTAAGVAMFLFALHTVNAITTYDVAFLPEILYTFFCLAALCFYVLYLRSEQRKFLWASVLCFGGGLLSKESSIMLPAVLLATSLWWGRRKLRLSCMSIAPHLLLLAIYFAFVVGHLGGGRRAAESLFDPPPATAPSSYHLVMDRTIVSNAATAWDWSFHIPRGLHTEGRDVPGWMTTLLRIFRILSLLLIGYALFTRYRTAVFAGLLLLVISIVPALPLHNHFLPYYLFLPVTGLCIALGAAITAGYEAVDSWAPVAPPLLAGSLLLTLGLMCIYSIQNDGIDNLLLGRSSRAAWNMLSSIRAVRPAVPVGARILFISDRESELKAINLRDSLIHLAYGDDTVQSLYSADGDLETSPMPTGNLVILKESGGSYTDVTRNGFKPSRVFGVDPGYVMHLSRESVTRGKDSYTLSVSGCAGAKLWIEYSLDDAPPQFFTATLDDEGKVSFEVKPDTPPGKYVFLAFKPEGRREWFRTTSSITVR